MNIVWMDLEFPSFHQGQIFECDHVILKYNLGTFLKCESDGATSIDLVRLNQHWQMWDRLYEFGHHKTLNENYEESSSKQQKDKINEYCLDGFRISIFSSRTNFRMCCYYY
ncbi:unnamed protein product [Rotaria socialis]